MCMVFTTQVNIHRLVYITSLKSGFQLLFPMDLVLSENIFILQIYERERLISICYIC